MTFQEKMEAISSLALDTVKAKEEGKLLSALNYICAIETFAHFAKKEINKEVVFGKMEVNYEQN